MTSEKNVQSVLPLEEKEPNQAENPVQTHGFWRARRLGFAVALAAATVDILTKLLVLAKISSLPIAVIPSFFTLTFAWNRGVSFSFLADAETPLNIFGLIIPAEAWLPALWSTVAVVAIGLFVWWLGKEEKILPQVAIGLIIGGAVGNLIDRLVHGAVVDFLLFYWDNWYFPAFNMADTWISCGVGLLFLDALRQNSPTKKKGDEKPDDA
ncbi:MAG: signal peptidase II [Alphaproteobacteria bacterium]|nr:signal peptidase II [Alphaproteobacteria bacterium]MDD9919886.1 signal peptidase II [Alphaproteobacteria bacterium]